MKKHYCSDCGIEMDEGEGSVFTCCESCWDKHYGEIEGVSKMSIGDKEVKIQGDFLIQDGLTYREWLIGMLASNPAHVPEKRYDYAEYLSTTADAIIKQLDKEIKK